jgi:hypothetical protein
MAALRGEVAALHRAFAESVARVVEEKLAAGFEAHSASVQKLVAEQAAGVASALMRPAVAQLREDVRQAEERAKAAAEAGIEKRLASLRDEIDGRDAELAALRARVGESDRNVLDLILALGQVCTDLAGRQGKEDTLAAPLPELPSMAALAPVSEAVAEPETPAAAPEPIPALPEPVPIPVARAGSAVPGFAELPAPKPWRAAVLSSLAVTGGALAALKFLLH